MVGTLLIDSSHDVAKSVAALRYLDPDCPRKEWVKVGMCLSSLGEVGRDLWFDWSQQSATKWNERDAENEWRRFRPDGGLTIATLLDMARQRGWDGTYDHGATIPRTPRKSSSTTQVKPKKPSPPLPTVEACQQAVVKQLVRDKVIKEGDPTNDTTFAYHDAAGAVIFLAVRVEFVNQSGEKEKTFKQFHAVEGGFQWGGFKPRPLYGIPKVLTATTIIITEGEKAADSINGILDAAGVDFIRATTSPCGAGAAKDADWSALSDKVVCVWRDNDGPGQEYCDDVVRMLGGLEVPPQKVLVIPVADFPEKSDAFDWVHGGCALGDAAEPWEFVSKLDDLLKTATEVELPPKSKSPTTKEISTTTDKPSTNGKPKRVEPVGVAPDEIDGIKLTDDRGLTEFSNGRRILRALGSRFRWVASWNRWYFWDGKRWKYDDTLRAAHEAKKVLDRLFAEAGEAMRDEEPGRIKKIASFVKASNSDHGLAAALNLVKSDLAVDWKMFDNKPDLLNVANGTLDLRTMELRPHCPSDNLTQLCDVEFNLDADCPMFLGFVKAIMDDRKDLIDYLHASLGYSITGHVSEHAMFLAYGSGGNGKSTLLELVMGLLGTDYAMTGASDLLVGSDDQHSTGLTDLHSKRLVVLQELSPGTRWRESLVKQLCGGDSIRARRMREDFWQFAPTHKTWVGCNHLPSARGTDNGLWRRLKVVPFDVKIGDKIPVDKGLREKLAAEQEGILLWLAMGAMDWFNKGLREPTQVESATSEYRVREDILGSFIEDECLLSSSDSVRARDLFDRYREWAKASNHKPMSMTTFGAEMAKRFTKARRSEGLRYEGLSLRPVYTVHGL